MGADEAHKAVEVAGKQCTDAAAACEHAQATALARVEWTTVMGLEAMAAVVQQAADALSSAVGLWRQAADNCEAANTAISSATQAAGSDTALDRLTTVADRLTAAQSAAATAADQANTAAERAEHTEIADATRTALAAVEAGAEASAGLETARQAVDTYRDQVRAAARAVAGSSDAGQHMTDRRQAIPDFTHRRPVSEAVEAIRREGWPRNADGRVSARGHLYDRGGTLVNDTVIRAHRKGEAPACDELREPWHSDPEYTTTWHAERDAAKMMRDKQMDYAVLYLNVPPCGKQSEDPQRCHVNIKKVLPRDAELYVWEISQTGSATRHIYRGTGEAIKNDH